MNTMKNSMVLPIVKTKYICNIASFILLALAGLGLFVGKYPLSFQALLEGETLEWRVFLTLRLFRVLVGMIGGMTLGICGFVYQTVFHNPLAAPDIVGVSSGAGAGAAAGIVLLGGGLMVTVFSFMGALGALSLALFLSGIDKSGRKSTIALSGIAVHALAQTVLMVLKLTADPERELASIEYWIMGSLSGISAYRIPINLFLSFVCVVFLFFLHRQFLLLSASEEEARMLGVNVNRVRMGVLLTATIAVSAIISLTGIISFVGLLAPHGARLLTRNNDRKTMLLSGILGGIILSGADILARSLAATELPISIFTSLLGVPVLVALILRRNLS